MSLLVSIPGLWIPRPRKLWRPSLLSAMGHLTVRSHHLLKTSTHHFAKTCRTTSCNGASCTFCTGGTPDSYQFVFDSVTLATLGTCYPSSVDSIKVFSASTPCGGNTANNEIADFNNTYGATQIAGGSCTWKSNGGGFGQWGMLFFYLNNSCSGGLGACSGLNIIWTRTNATTFTLDVVSSNGLFTAYLFRATVTTASNDCYFTGTSGSVTVSNTITSGVGWDSGTGFWYLGSGGTCKITPCYVAPP